MLMGWLYIWFPKSIIHVEIDVLQSLKNLSFNGQNATPAETIFTNSCKNRKKILSVYLIWSEGSNIFAAKTMINNCNWFDQNNFIVILVRQCITISRWCTIFQCSTLYHSYIIGAIKNTWILVKFFFLKLLYIKVDLMQI